jgi:hypothetical protein
VHDNQRQVVVEPPKVLTNRDPGTKNELTVYNYDGQNIQVNSGHGYNRPHTDPAGNARDFSGTGLSQQQIERAIVVDATSRGSSIPPAGPGAATTFSVQVNGHSVNYRAVLLPNGTIAISTYFP